MRFLAALIVLAASSQAHAQDDLIRRINDRIAKEFDDYAKRLKTDIVKLVAGELERAGYAPKRPDVPPPPKPPVEPPKDPPKDPPKPPPPVSKKPPYLGFVPDDFSNEQRKAAGLTPPNGLKILEVKKDGPAEKGGLKVGDILVTLGGKEISEENFGDLLKAYRAGDDVEFTIIRGGEKKTLKLKLGEKPD